MNVASVRRKETAKGMHECKKRPKGTQNVRQKAKTVFLMGKYCNAANGRKGCKGCKGQKRAAAQCYMNANNVRAHESTTHTIKLHTHENILPTYLKAKM